MYLALDFHAIPQMDCELPDVSKSMLVRSAVIHAEQLGSGVLHQVDGRKCMDAR